MGGPAEKFKKRGAATPRLAHHSKSDLTSYSRATCRLLRRPQLPVGLGAPSPAWCLGYLPASVRLPCSMVPAHSV